MMLNAEGSQGRMAAAFVVLSIICCAPAAADNFLQDMSDEMVANLTEYLENANVSFTYNFTPVHQAALPSYDPFDPRGMGMLYNFTPVVMDIFVKKHDFLPEGLVQVSDGHLEFDSTVSWRTLVLHYIGPISFIFVFMLFGLMLPLFGLFWCCCHMCRVGRRRRPFDRKHDGCLRCLLAILLIALLTMFLFGVVCTFATEQQLEEGVHALPRRARSQAHSVRAALNATADSVRSNTRQYAEYSNSGLDSMFKGIKDLIGGGAVLPRALAVTSLSAMVRRLDDVQRGLRDVQQHTAALRFQAGQLNAGLRKVKRNLLQTLASCDMPACVNLQRKHRIGELNTDIQYSQMPDVSDLLNNVTALIDGHIQEEVEDGQRVFRDIQTNIQRAVDDQLPRVRDVFRYITHTLSKLSDEVTRQTQRWDAELARAESRTSSAADDVILQYGPYRRYAGLGAACCLLLITLVLAWGLLCGVCGKRPDVYGANDCCNKGAGARGLYCGMVLMFALGGVFCVFSVAYFVIGVATQRLVCDPMRDPQHSAVFAVVDKFADVEGAMFQAKANHSSGLSVSALIQRCHYNHTLYEMFHVDRLIKSSSLRQKISAELASRAGSFTPVFPTGRVVILKDSAKRKLRMLADSGLSDFDFDRILTALETNMTSLELPGLARTLQRTADAVSERRGFRDVGDNLRHAAADLLDMHRDIVRPMLDHTAALNQTANKLRDSLSFNQSSLRDAVTSLLQQTAQAEDFLNEKGEQTVRQMVDAVAKYTGQQALKIFSSMVDREMLGRCAPLSAAYNRTVDAACAHVLHPVNGFWLSMAYCALLLIPLLMVSTKLARLYLQVDPYPGPLVEAEYLYDAYADRDNVPLANAYKMDKRYRGGGGGPRGGAGAGGGAAAPSGARAEAVAPPLDTHHARRYNDMAPKHWEEGPPRYHGPATEYERPPPYYYPGPNDRQ